MFSRPNPFEESVAAATNENLTSENWELILGVCDKVSRGTAENARDCVAAVSKRFTSKNANVQLYALALSEALVKNCDVTVHREISSRAFTTALSKLIRDRTTHESVRKRALELIQVCSLEFSTDSSLGLMNEVYHSLRADGIQFPNPQKPKKEYTQTELDKQKEEEELQLALALSLSESENRSTYRASSAVNKTTTSSSTPSSTNVAASAATAPKPKEDAAPKVSRVRALYDFQPTEQGELGFQKGDIIRVIESVYRDWWKGELRGQMGIFPVNYVEKLVDPSPSDLMKEAQMEAEVMAELQNVDRLLDMLARVDPQKDAFSENEELQNLYNKSLAIRPKLVRLIEKYSLKKDELVALNEKFLHARSMYDRMLGSSLAKYTNPGVPADYSMPQQAYGMYQQQQPQGQPAPYQPQQPPQQPMYSSGPPSEPSYQAYQQPQQPQPQQQQQTYPQTYPAQASPGMNHQQQYPPQEQPQQQQAYPPQDQQQQPPQQPQQPQQQPQAPAYGYPDAAQLQQQTQSPPPAYGYPQTAPLQQNPQSPSNVHAEQAVHQQQAPQQQQYPPVQPTSTSTYPPQPSYSSPAYPSQQPDQSQPYPNTYGLATPMTPQQQHSQPTAYPQYPPQQQYAGANQAYAQNY